MRIFRLQNVQKTHHIAMSQLGVRHFSIEQRVVRIFYTPEILFVKLFILLNMRKRASEKSKLPTIKMHTSVTKVTKLPKKRKKSVKSLVICSLLSDTVKCSFSQFILSLSVFLCKFLSFVRI